MKFKYEHDVLGKLSDFAMHSEYCVDRLSRVNKDLANELLNVKINNLKIADFFDTPMKLIEFLDMICESASMIELELEQGGK